VRLAAPIMRAAQKPALILLIFSFLAELLALLKKYRDNEKSEMTEIRQFRTCHKTGISMAWVSSAMPDSRLKTNCLCQPNML